MAKTLRSKGHEVIWYFQVCMSSLNAVVLNWGCSHPQRVREGTFWGANFSAKLLFSTNNNTSNGARGAKMIFPFGRGAGFKMN